MSLLLAGMDATIVNVSLPVIQKDLHASLAQLQWVLDAYTLVVASLLMLSGSMSDRYGRRLVFQIGMTLFCAGSLLCSLAQGIGELILFRAMQGLGASMLNPVAMSIVANVFPEPKDRARAVGVWGAVGGIAFALGPVLGGTLTQTVGWRSIFWINIPIGLAGIVLAAKFVPESKAARARRFDPVGQALVFVGLVSLTYSVIEGPRTGWSSPMIVGLFGLAAACAMFFLFYEPRRTDPLLDFRFFRSIPFSTAAILGLLAFSSFAGFLFLSAIYLQRARGFSALHTGLSMLPLAVMMFVCSLLSGRMVGRFGTRPSVLAAGTAFVLATLMLTRLNVVTPLGLLMLAFALFGVGLGMVNPAISNNAVAGMPLAQAGVAAAIASTSRQVGAALGVAVAGTVVSVSRASGADFTQATHPMWWLMVAGGVVVLVVGWVSTTAWAHASTEKVAHLLGGAVRTEA